MDGAHERGEASGGVECAKEIALVSDVQEKTSQVELVSQVVRVPEVRGQGAVAGEAREDASVKAAIFLDVEYFRIACGEWLGNGDVLTTEKFIRVVKASAPDGFYKDVTRWRCFAYDAWYRKDAIPFVQAKEVELRGKIHEKLRRGGFTLKQGQFVRKQNAVVQKGVDTQLVVDAMQEAAYGGTKVFIFVTGDTDFLPLFRALRGARKRTVLLHGDLGSVNSKLLSSVESAFDIMRGIQLVRGTTKHGA